MDFPDAAQKWDARYSKSANFLFGQQPNAWLCSQAHWLNDDAKLCCLADGEGRNSVWLASQKHRVGAFDLSPVAVARCQSFAAKQQVQVQARVASIQHWIDDWRDPDKPPCLDAVVAIFIQFAGPDLRASLFDAIKRALKPAGILIIEGYGYRQLQFRTGGPGVVEHLYSPSLLPNAFKGWSVLASRDAEIQLAEGSGHVGRSHVISAVLRKPGAVA